MLKDREPYKASYFLQKGRENYTVYNEKLTPMKGHTMSNTKAPRAIRFLASVALVPHAVASLPKAAIQSAQDTLEDVREEMDRRKAAVRLIEREPSEA